MTTNHGIDRILPPRRTDSFNPDGFVVISVTHVSEDIHDIHRHLPRRADCSPRRRLGALSPGPRQPARPARQPGAGAAAADVGTEAQFRRGPAWPRKSRRRTRRSASWRFAGWWGWARSWRVGAGFLASTSGRPSPAGPLVTAIGASMAGNPPLQALRPLASDPRWRIREAVAMALQRWGDADMPALLAEMAIGRAAIRGSSPRPPQRCASHACCGNRHTRPPCSAFWTRSRHPSCILTDRKIGTCAQDAAPGPGLLLERRGRRAAGRRQTANGEMARQPRSRHPLDYAR